MPVGDVALGQFRRRNDRGIGDIHAVMHLVALFQATQDSDGVFLAGLVDQHFLEATLQGGIFFHVLAILVQGSGTNTVQLAAGQGRLQHVAGIHGALGFTGANHGMQLIDKQDDASFLLGQLVQYGLEALLEVTPELGPGQQRTQVQRQDALVFQALWHLTVNHPLGQALDNRRLADTGLPDKNRVVLGAALQHLDRTADFVIAADYRIEFALLGTLSQVYGVFIQRLSRLLGLRIIHRFAATHVVDSGFQSGRRHTVRFKHLTCGCFAFQHGQQHQLAGDVGIPGLLGKLVSDVKHPAQVVGD